MKKLLRRSFLKQGMIAGGGLTLISHTSLFGNAPEEGFPNETLKTIHSMRSIHGNFNNKEIPDEQVDQILKASVRAANSSNMQTYSIIVVKDRDKMQQICGYQGSCMLIYCVDYNRSKQTAEHLGYEFYSDNIVSLLTGSINTMLAAQTAVIAAKSLGIDSLLTNGVHRGDMERHWKILNLPEKGCFPMIALLLGYPTEEPAFEKGRLDGPGVFHNESYHMLTQDEKEKIVNRYDDKNEHVALIEDWDKQGHKHFLDWLHKSWLRGNDKPTSEETQMLKLLKKCGFIDLQKS